MVISLHRLKCVLNCSVVQKHSVCLVYSFDFLIGNEGI